MRLSVSRRSLLAAFAILGGMTASIVPGIAQSKRVQVVATTAMIGDAVKAVGGDRVNVEVLLGQGVDPHLYKPTRADIAKMSKADMIVANGLNLEAQFRDTFEQLGRTKPVVLAGEYAGAFRDAQGKQRTAFTASTTINRNDFGVAWNRAVETGALLGDDVTIDIAVQAVRQ